MYWFDAGAYLVHGGGLNGGWDHMKNSIDRLSLWLLAEGDAETWKEHMAKC